MDITQEPDKMAKNCLGVHLEEEWAQLFQIDTMDISLKTKKISQARKNFNKFFLVFLRIQFENIEPGGPKTQ